MNKASSAPPYLELVYHSFWRNQSLPATYQTECGKSLAIVFCGWYNRSAGPDFLSAQIVIDGRRLTGDIEIHIEQSDWIRHKHQTNPDFDRVILHVFVNPSGENSRTSQGREITALRVNPAMISKADAHNPRKMLEASDGACGLLINERNQRSFKKILTQAAETRILVKSQKTKELLQSVPEEELLYRYIIRAFGLKKHGDAFWRMAEALPYNRFLRFASEKTYADAAKEILEGWRQAYIESARSAGLTAKVLDAAKGVEPPSSSRNDSGAALKFTGSIYNNINRGMILALKHLYATKNKGLLREWAEKILEIGSTDKHALKKNTLITLLKPLFSAPSIEPPQEKEQEKAGKTKAGAEEAMNIGAQKIVIVMANAVLPFFIAWAQTNRREDMLPVLFRIFSLLPSESPNKKTEFMLKRLSLDQNFTSRGGMMHTQGLIQLHDDCCHYFQDGCANCTLASRLAIAKDDAGSGAPSPASP